MKTLLLAAAITGFAGVASAQDADVGHELFSYYCSACHGASGKGDGDMAAVMTIPAPNLTLLANRNDGKFPMLNVIHIIDGRTGMRAHGGAMPVFGALFAREAGDDADTYGNVIAVRGRIMSLALYLESIQQM